MGFLPNHYLSIIQKKKLIQFLFLRMQSLIISLFWVMTLIYLVVLCKLTLKGKSLLNYMTAELRIRLDKESQLLTAIKYHSIQAPTLNLFIFLLGSMKIIEHIFQAADIKMGSNLDLKQTNIYHQLKYAII